MSRSGDEPREVPAALREWAAAVDVSRLTDRTAKDCDWYLRKYRRLNGMARVEASTRLMRLLAVQVSPPPPATVSPLDAIAVVVAARRELLRRTTGDTGES